MDSVSLGRFALLHRLIKAAFERQDDDTLEKELQEDLQGVFEDVLVATVTSHREEGYCEEVSFNVASAIFNDGKEYVCCCY